MKKVERKSKLSRKTRETQIDIELNIDGSGRYKVSAPDAFLRHMLETLARYASFDVSIEAAGDMEHHLVEDTAIALGAALRQAIGGEPVKRVASTVVPMDEALVLVAIDLIDRPYVEVEVPELIYAHFFRSFAMESRATIHSKTLRGQDSHHIIEATFKALGLCLKDATRRAEATLSTKSNVDWGKSSEQKRRGGRNA